MQNQTLAPLIVVDHTERKFATGMRKRKRCVAEQEMSLTKPDLSLGVVRPNTPPGQGVDITSPFHTPSPNSHQDCCHSPNVEVLSSFPPPRNHHCSHTSTPPKPSRMLRTQHGARRAFSEKCPTISPFSVTVESPKKSKRICVTRTNSQLVDITEEISSPRLRPSTTPTNNSKQKQQPPATSTSPTQSFFVCTPPRSLNTSHLLFVDKTPGAPRRRRRRDSMAILRLPDFPAFHPLAPKSEEPQNAENTSSSDNDFDPNESCNFTYADFKISFEGVCKTPTVTECSQSTMLPTFPVEGIGTLDDNNSNSDSTNSSPQICPGRVVTQIIPLGLCSKRTLPLLLAARTVSLASVKRLLDAKANPNGVNDLNQNALHFMCAQPHGGFSNYEGGVPEEKTDESVKIVQLLLESGTSALHRDCAGFVPLYYATIFRHTHIVDVLRIHKRKLIRLNFENFVTGSVPIPTPEDDETKWFLVNWATPQRDRLAGDQSALSKSPHKFVSNFIHKE